MKKERAKKRERNEQLQKTIIGLILALIIMIGSAIAAMLQL